MDMNSIKYGIAVLSSLAVLAGCQTEKAKLDEHHFENKLYINTQQLTQEVAVKPTSTTAVRTLSIGTALPLEEKLTGVFVADTNYVATFRDEYNEPDAKSYPLRDCAITGAEVTIEAGSNISSPATVTFSNMGALDRSQVYVMPVALKNVTDINVIGSKKVVYYIFKGAALINVVANISQNYLPVKWTSNVSNMTSITVEALINVSDYSNMGSLKNVDMSTVFGIEGTFLVRIGDAGYPMNAVQLVNPNGNFPSATVARESCLLPTDKWVHIAVVWDATTGDRIIYYDGEEVARDGKASGSFDLTGGTNGCYVGYAYTTMRWLEGCISELRVWNVQRSQEQIKEHFYEVDPASEGLVAYWKFNEGAGSNIADATGHGNNLVSTFPIKWQKVSLPEN